MERMVVAELTVLLLLFNSVDHLAILHIPSEGRVVPVKSAEVLASSDSHVPPVYWVGTIGTLPQYKEELYATGDRILEGSGTMRYHNMLGFDLISEEHLPYSIGVTARSCLTAWPEMHDNARSMTENRHLLTILSCIPDVSTHSVDIDHFPCIAKKFASLPTEERSALSYFFSSLETRLIDARMRAFIVLFRIAE